MSLTGRHRADGFTLLELLIAIAVTAGIIGAMLALYHGVTVATGSTGESYINLSSASSALEIVRRDIASAVSSSALGGLPFILEPPPSTGEGTMSLIFYSIIDSEAVAEDLPPVGIARITYSVVKSTADDDYVLVRELSRLKGSLEWDEPEATEIARRVRGVQTAAYDGENWYAEWPVQAGPPMPEAMSVTLTCGDGDAQKTLETIAVIRAGRQL